MMFHKNHKQYYATVINREAVTLKSPDSEVTLEISQGLKAVIMQHIHTDFEAACKSIPTHECLVSPVVRFIVKMEINSIQEISYSEPKFLTVCRKHITFPC